MSKLIETAPQEIYLNVAEEPCELDEPFPPNHEDITWCEDSVLGAEVKYIRADLHDQLRARNAELERQLETAKVAAEFDQILLDTCEHEIENLIARADQAESNLRKAHNLLDKAHATWMAEVEASGKNAAKARKEAERAEQAEQRIAESQRQGPVAWAILDKYGRVDGGLSDGATPPEPRNPDTGIQNWSPLYAAPIVPPDVEEAVKVEREACADIASNHACGGEDDIICQGQNCGTSIAGSIRTRNGK